MVKNRKSMVNIVVIFCVAALTAFTSIAQAAGGRCGGEPFGKHQQHDFKKIARKLGLTNVQKAQAKTIFLSNKEVVKPIITSLRSEQVTLRALIHADPIDIAAIRAETVKMSNIQAELNINRAKVGARFRAILTPEQLATLKTMIKKGQHKGDVTSTPAE